MLLFRPSGVSDGNYEDSSEGVALPEELNFMSVENNLWYGPDFFDEDEAFEFEPTNNCRNYIEELMHLRTRIILFPRDREPFFSGGKVPEELEFF